MKKKIIYAVCFIVFLITAPSCSKTCSFCKLVTTDSGGNVINSGSETEYCGADLIAFKAANLPTTVGGNTTTYSCR